MTSFTRRTQTLIWPRWLGVAAPWVVLAGLGVLALLLPAEARNFPETWNFHLRAPIDAFQDWVITNRATHPMFVFFFDPLSDLIDFGLRQLENVLLATPWYIIWVIFGALGLGLGGWRLSALALGGLLFVGLIGLWDEGMQTLALMGIAVLLALGVGIPIGIAASRSNALDAALRPILDAMQTMPAFVYLIPVLLFFGVARVPSVIATVIFAIPPIIRLTDLGLRQVPPELVEAAHSFGSTSRQMLLKVMLPLALPSIMSGVNQTIMAALGMVVIAALIGAGGLGRVVTQSLQRLLVGRALEAGLAIVIVAIVLDRLSAALSKIDLAAEPSREPESPWQISLRRVLEIPATLMGEGILRVMRLAGYRPANLFPRVFYQRYTLPINAVLLIAALGLTSLIIPAFNDFPENWNLRLSEPVDAAVKWMSRNLYEIAGLPILVGTGPLSDFLTLYLMEPMRVVLRDALPWMVVVAGLALLAWATAGWRLGLGAGVGLLFIGFFNMWEPSMDTLSQVLVAVVFSVLIAIPLGIASAQNDTFQAWLRPVLDFLQTIPPFVYLVPVIMLFNVGRVPGLIASVLYALPPAIRLTDLGIRQVAPEVVEAAHAFGSTARQTLLNVQLPLALPAILAGINQTIMLVLSMVIIAGLVGGAGLGLESVNGLARNETGRGIEAGLSIVILAMIIDRLTQAWAGKGKA